MSAEPPPPAQPRGGPQGRAFLEALAVAEWPVRGDFEDPRLEGRRLFSELLGTFLLVLAGAGGGVVDAVSHGAIGRIAAVTAPGLMVMAIILFMGAVSGAHLNPAVTISFAARGDFPWRRVPGYILAQLAGATLACVVLWALFGKIGMLGATEPGAGITDLQAFGIELLLTVGLVSTILGTASRAQNVGPLSALAVGGYIILAGLWSSPISGASMNPARSFGPDAALGDFHHYWPYLAGPLLGGLVAVVFAYLLRGRGGDRPALLAAQGSLPEVEQPSRANEVTPGGRGREPSGGSKREPSGEQTATRQSSERSADNAAGGGDETAGGGRR